MLTYTAVAQISLSQRASALSGYPTLVKFSRTGWASGTGQLTGVHNLAHLPQPFHATVSFLPSLLAPNTPHTETHIYTILPSFKEPHLFQESLGPSWGHYQRLAQNYPYFSFLLHWAEPFNPSKSVHANRCLQVTRPTSSRYLPKAFESRLMPNTDKIELQAQ